METIKKGDFVSMVSCKIAKKYNGAIWEVAADPWLLLDTVLVATLKDYKGNAFSGFPISNLKVEDKKE